MLDSRSSGARSGITADETRHQLEHILGSAAFRNTQGLQKFLEYVVSKTIQGQSQEIKEYAIAVEVLGKSSDYDPRLDTSVRVQAHRLREKLEEYYGSQGAADEIVIELPKGHYVPQFSRRLPPVVAGEDSGLRNQVGSFQATPPLQHRSRISRRALLWIAGGLAAILIFMGGIELSQQVHHLFAGVTGSRPGAADPAAVRNENALVAKVWSHFWRDSGSPVVAYSNSMFLVTETSDLLRLKAADVNGLGAPATGGETARLAENPRLVEAAGPVFYEDGYTGTGEVMAVFYLTRFFLAARIPLKVERSQLIETSDLRDQNVIFLGSVLENPVLAGLPLSQDFVFSQPSRPPTLWRARIVNLHPRAGEQPFYQIERDDKTQVLRADYALVSFLPGVAPGREIVVLGGLTTTGTQGAAQFATSSAGAKELLVHLGTPVRHSSARELPPFFQAVLRVDIRQDEILSVHYVAGRVIQPAQSNS